jgi:hypothetical protein
MPAVAGCVPAWPPAAAPATRLVSRPWPRPRARARRDVPPPCRRRGGRRAGAGGVRRWRATGRSRPGSHARPRLCAAGSAGSRPVRADPPARHPMAALRLDVGVVRIDPGRDTTPVKQALGLLLAASAAAERRFGRRARSRCEIIVALCPGRLLVNTSCPTRCDGQLTASWSVGRVRHQEPS